MVTGIDVDRVRLLCGDPAGDTQVLDDGEIYFFLGEHSGDKYAAAAAAADAIAAHYASRVDVRVGILSSSDSQLAAQFRQLAAGLRQQAGARAQTAAVPFAGGALAVPAFTRTLHDETDGLDGLDGDDDA